MQYFGAVSLLLCALLVAGCTHEDESDPTVIIEIGNADGTVYPRTNGLLSGLFDVGGGSRVRFAQGNLQYQPSTGTWRLAQNQYDRIGSLNAYLDPTSSYWTDLFVWGSSGCDTNIPPYFVFRDSSDIQIDSTTYITINSNYMSPTNQYDWGVFNTITSAGDSAGWFHTLTSVQWGYLLNQRYMAKEKRGMAEVEGTTGYVLLPESWLLPEGCSFVPDSSSDTLVSPFVNVYNKKQWQLMEDEGAVFLPFAGQRVGRQIKGIDWRCYYWTSSTFSTFNGLVRYADLYKKAIKYTNWYYGNAVRLVYFEPSKK